MAHCGAHLATLGCTPSKGYAGHSISPRLLKQLVLKLKGGVVTAEIFELLPSSVLLRKPTPLDPHVTYATPLLCLEPLLRLRKDAPVKYGRKHAWGNRWVAAVRLQQPDMEDVVNAGAC